METKNPILICFGERVAKLRKDNHLSQIAFADKCGIDKNHLGCIERGEKCPSLLMLYKLADGLEINIKELFE